MNPKKTTENVEDFEKYKTRNHTSGKFENIREGGGWKRIYNGEGKTSESRTLGSVVRGRSRRQPAARSRLRITVFQLRR